MQTSILEVRWPNKLKGAKRKKQANQQGTGHEEFDKGKTRDRVGKGWVGGETKHE